MSSERISRLQRYILTEAYKTGKGREERTGDKSDYFIDKCDIYIDYFKIDPTHIYLDEDEVFGTCRIIIRISFPKWKQVSLSRSLRKLKERDYIDYDESVRWVEQKDKRRRAKPIFKKQRRFTNMILLTDKGIKKAAELLNV